MLYLTPTQIDNFFCSGFNTLDIKAMHGGNRYSKICSDTMY